MIFFCFFFVLGFQATFNRNNYTFISLPGLVDSKEIFGLRVKMPPAAHLFTTKGESFTVHTGPFNAEDQAGKLVMPMFMIIWFDPTGNRTRAYRFSSRRPIHLTKIDFWFCF